MAYFSSGGNKKKCFLQEKSSRSKREALQLETKKMKKGGEIGSDGGTKGPNQKRCPP
jgi:hypothetical protein